MKTNRSNFIKNLAAILAVPMICTFFNPQASAATFTAGNVVVTQYGDGVATLGAPAAAISVLEYLPSTASQVSPVQTIAIPSTGATKLTGVGSSGSEGFINRSTNSSSIIFSGYDADAGAGALAATSATLTNRLIGKLDVAGNFTRTAGGSGTAFSGSNIRSGASDGTAYWMAGTASSSANGGIWYSASGGTPTQITNGNLRVVRVFNNNLYYSTGAGTVGIWGFNGIPTVSAAATNMIVDGGTSPSPYDFAINSTGTILYFTDDRAIANVGSGIQKWTFSGGIWTSNYTFGSGAVLTAGCRGLAVDFSGANPVIFATTADAATKLITITDTGFAATATTLATAGSNKSFKGVALAPIATSSGPPIITGLAPAGTTNSTGNSVSFTVTAAGSTPFSYFWYKIIPGTSTNLIPSATFATLSFPSAATTNSANYQVVVSNSVAPFTATSSIVTLLITNAPPSITGITPLAFTNTAGSAASFTVTAAGSAPLSYYWYKEIPGTSTNLIPSATTATLSFPATVVSDTASYQLIVSNSYAPFTATSAVVSLVVTAAPPVITGIGPATIIQNAGLNASFTVTNTGTPPFTFLWYKGSIGSGVLIPSATTNTLSLTGVIGSSAGNYYVVVTNASGPATSSVVSLTVTNDPHIAVQPVNAAGLIGGTVQFYVGVIGTTPTYQWYYANPGGSLIGPVANGSLGGGSVVSGSTSSLLTIANLQTADLSAIQNLAVVATTAYGSVQSTNAGLLSLSYANTLAFWDFNGSEFTNAFNNPNNFISPAPYIGVGTASGVNVAAPFSGAVDANDGLGFTLHLPPFSWGTSTYPTNGNPANNKTAGAQFTVSTVGAKNVKLSYETRGTATASKFERLQYTTDGSTWIDYPTTSSFGTVASQFIPFNYNFTGFPGVANNASFGVRIVSELQNTATYGVSANTNYIGIANNYGASGTLTYDLVTFTAEAITNANVAPTITSFPNTNMLDYVKLTNSFMVGDDSTPLNSLTLSAVSLNAADFNPSFAFEGSGTNRTLIITPNSIAQTVAAAPILVTVTDGNGDSTATWFNVLVGTVNLPPTNSLTKLSATNTLANTALTIPFSVGDDRTGVSGLTYTVSSGNTTVVPNDSVNNIIIGGAGTATPTLTVIPAANQLGEGTITVTVSDNDVDAPKSTTATFPIMVRPNTNIVAIDYFNYDTSGSLDSTSFGYWRQLSGVIGQMQVGGGVVTVDTANNTENVLASLLGAPYSTNGAGVLYASFIVNMSSTIMPRVNGSYFTGFSDGANTANIEGLLVAATNGAAPGYYRLGINNRTGAVGTNSQMFAADLLPDSNYVAVVSTVVSNGVSTLWVNPNTAASSSVTDTSALTTKYNLSAFELRQSGANAGSIKVSRLKIGTTFESVFPSLNVRVVGTKAVVSSSDPTLGIQSTTNLAEPFMDVSSNTPYTNSMSNTNVLFFRFKP